MRIDLDKPGTQRQFATVVGVTESTVSHMRSAGRLEDGATLGAWVLSYCKGLRDEAAGRENELASERARLARAQSERVELQNGVTRGELAPVDVLEAVLAKVSSEIAAMLESIPSQLRRANARLSASDVEIVAKVIAKARNAAAGAEIDLSALKDESGTDPESDTARA